MSAGTRHVLIGTAGHIDHGKTRLVARLTGVDTDRLPEEKARGISIDLGFAHWEQAGIVFDVVDVPGHERFVKNMVAGATGIDMALLVVAADDGVMPQTREHLDIMQLLGVKTGVMVITKTDLVDSAYLALVREELLELTAGTFLEDYPLLPVSSATGAGIDELRGALVQVADAVDRSASGWLFRMPIDRAFTMTGHGTVVTGSVLSGAVTAGDELELLPERRTVRVREVQVHGSTETASGAHCRTAINLAGMKVEEVARGMELATPGYLQPSQRLLVSLRTLPSGPTVLKDRQELRLHLGTAEVTARLVMKEASLTPGDFGYAELRTQAPIVATYGQRFILRRISPPLTVAGGTVLDPWLASQRRISNFSETGRFLETASERERLSHWLAQQDIIPESSLEAAWRADVPPERYAALVAELREGGELVRVGTLPECWIHRDRWATVRRLVLQTVRREVARQQPRRSLPRATLLAACEGLAVTDVLAAVLADLVRTRELVEIGAKLGPADLQVQLTKQQQRTRDHLLQQIIDGGVNPPTVKELAQVTGQPVAEVLRLLNLCVEDGLLVRVSDQLYYSRDALARLRTICVDVLTARGEATVSDLREAWGVTRKFAVPLSEYFDAAGVMQRRGDVRVPGARSNDVF